MLQIPNVYEENCPTRMVLDHIADKWTALILWKLTNRPIRFNQLRRDIEGISQKVLSQTLKQLERDGLINRQAFATVPVTVEYSVTPLGHTLAEKMAGISLWAQDNIDQVLAAQAKYDATVVR
ncbi:MAG: winged helix-turn-helix transcriptional regulator [Rhizobiaceae bacterium]